jgi:hypothetical protein
MNTGLWNMDSGAPPLSAHACVRLSGGASQMRQGAPE